MSDFRRIYALMSSLRKGVDAIEWSEEHALPIPDEHVELTALIAGELAEAVAALVDREATP